MKFLKLEPGSLAWSRKYDSIVLGLALSASLYLWGLPACATDAEAVSLNNEGVKSLHQNETETAIYKFKLALKKSPGYKLALENLAVAYNNTGIAEQKDERKSLRDFHMAAWFDPRNATTLENTKSVIKSLKKNPASFEDRVQLADDALKDGDFAGAIVEYRAALEIKEDAQIRKKMAEVKIPDEWSMASLNPAFNQTVKTAAKDVDFGPYMASLQRRIKRAWFPPKGDESRKITVLYKINTDGTIADLRIDHSSGVVAADEAALAAVKNAAPMDHLPDGSPAVVDIQFTFDYNVFNGKQTDPEERMKKEIAKLEKKGANESLVKSLIELAHYYDDGDHDDDAVPLYKKAIDLLQSKVHDDDELADASSALGVIHYIKDEYDAALPLCRRAVELYSKLGDAHRLASSRKDLALDLIYQDDSHNAEAQELLQQALTEAKKENDDNFALDIKCGLAHAYWQAGDYAKALPLYQLVEAAEEKSEGPESSEIFQYLKDIADCQYHLEQYKEALPVYKRALALAEKMDQPDADEVSEAKSNLEVICHKLGLPTDTEVAQDKESKQSVNKAYSWLPFAFAGALLALFIIYLLGARQNGTIDIVGKNRDKDR